MLACDVLLGVEDLAFLRARYEADRPCALWFPVVARPADASLLGAHAWKPAYPVAAPPGEAPLDMLPGHLGVLEPEALRLPLVRRLFDAAYRARNRSVRSKRRAMIRAVVGGLLATDLRLLLGLRAPTRTLTTVRAGSMVARGLRTGSLSLEELERHVGTMLLRRSHRRRSPASGVRFPPVDRLRLAEDVDTLEEARARAWTAEDRGTS